MSRVWFWHQRRNFVVKTCHKKSSIFSECDFETKEVVHKSINPYKCKLCLEGFDGENNFNGDIELVHEGIKPYERNLLNVTFVVNDFN